jgi:hypothetical protein
VEAKVLEIDQETVKYKKFSNQDGPTYNLTKAEIHKIKYENGEEETFKNSALVNTGGRKIVFVKITPDSDINPSDDTWNEEFEKNGFIRAKNIQEANLIFEFRIKRAMGEARVAVNVINPSDNKLIWESDKYRGTSNVYNRMGASLDALRKCFRKGIIPALEKGKF